MKLVIIGVLLIMLCCTVSAFPVSDDAHYVVLALVWDNETGLPEENVEMTFGGSHVLYTASDGSAVFDTANMDDVRHGHMVDVSCKYGTESVPVIMCTWEEVYNMTSEQNEMAWVRHWGIAATFNAPNEHAVVSILAAMGFVVVSIGGFYLLRKRGKDVDK